MKSLVFHLIEYVEAMFKDIAYAYRHPRDWSRDKSRLIHELGVNGERVLTIDLPALDKHFCKCLDIGLYTPSGLPYGSLGSRVQVPAFMRDLYLQVFDVEGRLREAPSTSAIVVIRQLLAGAKKLPLPCSKEKVNAEVYNFYTIERAIRPPTLDWVGDDLFGLDPSRESEDRVSVFDGVPAVGGSCTDLFGDGAACAAPSDRQLTLLEQVFDRVAAQLGDFFDDVDELPKHGPGLSLIHI